MKQKKALYEDVVVGGSPPPKNSEKARRPSGSDKKQQSSDRSSGQKSNHSEKDESPHTAIEKRAEKLSEEPFMTETELKTAEGGTKEKQEEADQEEPQGESQDGSSDKRKKEIKETKKDLDIIASRADKILFRAKAIFPFDFFPNTITIDANKVNIIISTFFFTETVTSVLLKEIMDVRVEAALFLGKLIIDYGPHPLKIRTVYVASLWKKDALKAKEIIEGNLVLYRGENIDTTKLKPEETIEEIKEVGKVDEERP